jgi:hypothetical protein
MGVEGHAPAALALALPKRFICMSSVGLDPWRTRGRAEAGGAQTGLSAGLGARFSAIAHSEFPRGLGGLARVDPASSALFPVGSFGPPSSRLALAQTLC